MIFPPLTAFLANLCIFVPGLLFFVVGLGYSIQYLRDRRTGRIRPNNPPLRITLCFMFLGSVFTCALIASIFSYTFFHLDLTTVRAIQVSRLSDETSMGSEPIITITDPHLLATGLTQFTTARAHLRNHEGYTDGYRIVLVRDVKTHAGDYVVRLFRQSSSTKQPVAVLLTDKWEYSCPALLTWIEMTVDPVLPAVSSSETHQDGH